MKFKTLVFKEGFTDYTFVHIADNNVLYGSSLPVLYTEITTLELLTEYFKGDIDFSNCEIVEVELKIKGK